MQEIESRLLDVAIGAVIFDFDGTLYNRKHFPLRLIAEYPPDILKIYAERQVRKEYLSADFGSEDALYEAFFKSLGIRCKKSPDAMRHWYFERYLPRMGRVLAKYYKAEDYAEPLLVKLRQAKIPVAVFSDYPFTQERMRAVGLEPSRCGVTALYGPESFGAFKPAKRPFLRISEDLCVPPEKIVVVGDRDDTDGEGARRAGMKFILVEG